MRDSKKPDARRMEAAQAVAPYLMPRLNSVQLNRPDFLEGKPRKDLLAELKTMLDDPETRALLMDAPVADRVSASHLCTSR
jgi:hypothetical protein